MDTPGRYEFQANGERTIEDVGVRLRNAREARNLTLRDISDATKVPVRVLDAMERNDRARLPHEFFTRGFVRAYAAEVGLDAEETAEDYAAQFMKETPNELESAVTTASEGGPARSEARAGHAPLLVLCSVVAGYGINSVLTVTGAQVPAAPTPPPLVAAVSVCIPSPATESVPVIPVLTRQTRRVPQTVGTSGTGESSVTAAAPNTDGIPNRPSVVPLTIDSLPIVPIPTVDAPPAPSTPPIG